MNNSLVCGDLAFESSKGKSHRYSQKQQIPAAVIFAGGKPAKKLPNIAGVPSLAGKRTIQRSRGISVGFNSETQAPKRMAGGAFGKQSPPKKALKHMRGETQNRWLSIALALFKDFETLSDGWDTYNAPRPNGIAIANARWFTISNRLGKFRPTRIAPSVVGGIGITFRRGDHLAYLEFNNDGMTSFLLAREPNEPMVDPIGNDVSSYREAGDLIQGFLDE